EYAVASFKGSQAELIEVYQDLLDAWIVAQGRQRNYAVLWLESYPRPYQRTQPDLELEIWLPLIPE
ncbi:MAG TPA: GyrI-like domain-containing protein, partial [Thermomicrobiales bacterium]|nr:GyrI-like domain-containing protein [Thermomicrobiales bacterium]